LKKGVEMQKKLLVISRYIPRPDLNSGDLRFYSMLKILSSYFEITCLVPNLTESDHKYRSQLGEIGIRVLPGLDRSFRETLKKNKFSVVLFEFYFQAEYFLPRIRILQPECLIVIDSVDVNYYRAFSKHEVTKKMEDLEKAKEIKRLELSAYKKADMVIAVTDEDATVLTSDCPELRVRIIPNIHSLNVPNSTPEKDRLIFVGGFTHDPNIDAVMYFCHEILPIIRRKIPTIKVDIVGSNPTAEVEALKDGVINVTGYVKSTTPYLHRNYISIAPLRYGAGMKGKIGEAMAHGRPIVTTSIGAQGMGLTNRKNVLIADSPKEFSDSVIELIQNADLYETIQKNAIDHVERYYTEEKVEKGIQIILSEINKQPPQRISLFEKSVFYLKYAWNHLKSI
jgi:O-antigen biosynthesis protein